MAKSFTCPKGHRWRSGNNDPGELTLGAIACPECGGPAETLEISEPTSSEDRITAPPPSPVDDNRGTTPRAIEVPGYELIAELGRGGMGVVYRARQCSLNRTVALKVIRSGDFASGEERARFHAEAESAALLRHPNIVHVYEVGEAHGLPFLSMEWVEGGSLDRRLARKPPTPREAAELTETLARAMHAAHRHQLVHRDLKPANILLSADGTPKITDFGLAKRLDSDQGATRTGVILGTPSYMAPEQASGATSSRSLPSESCGGIGPSADIYSLGAILYEMLTGRPPFRGSDPLQTLDQVRHQEPAPPSTLNSRVPRDLETICLKCLHKAPGQRYGTALELADDLHRFLAGEPIRARPVGMIGRTIKWAKRRPLAATAVAAALGLLAILGGVGLWYWDARLRVKVEYYSAFVKRWGSFEGVGLLAPEQVRRRHVSLKFYRRAGRVEQVDFVNGSGQLTKQNVMSTLIEGSSGMNAGGRPECTVRFTRNERGDVIEESTYDQWGELVYAFHYTTRNTAHFTDKTGFARALAGTGASYVELQWSKEGYLEECRYLDKHGKRQRARDGDYGFRLHYNAAGLVSRRIYFDRDGEPMLNKYGFATMTQSYDSHGNSTRHEYFDRHGKPCITKQGFAVSRHAYDSNGNCTEVAFYGLDGLPAPDKSGVARWTRGYDQHGNESDIAYFGPDGAPVIHKHAKIHRIKRCFDQLGNPIETEYQDTKGAPCAHADGYARSTARYDQRGNMVEAAFFDVQGRPCVDLNHVARWTREHDSRGNAVAWAFFGVDGQPALHRSGYAAIKSVFDQAGHETEISYWGIDGQACADRNNVARWTRKYDDRGNEIERAFFGIDGRPVLHKSGYTRLRSVFDDQGNKIEESHYGLDNQLVVPPNNVARWTATHDDVGNVTSFAYFGSDGKPMLNPKDGFAKTVVSYDARGNRTSVAGFGIDGLPTLGKGGTHEVRAAFDERGNKIETSFFGVDGKPIPWVDGAASSKSVFDERDREVAILYFGVDGRPVLNKLGFAKVTFSYDIFDKRNGQTNWVLDSKNVYARVERRRDPGGRIVEESYFTEAGQPAVHLHGYAKKTMGYDGRPGIAEFAYFDLEGRPALYKGIYARIIFNRDDKGVIVSTTTFDRDGRPLRTVTPKAKSKKGEAAGPMPPPQPNSP